MAERVGCRKGIVCGRNGSKAEGAGEDHFDTAHEKQRQMDQMQQRDIAQLLSVASNATAPGYCSIGTM